MLHHPSRTEIGSGGAFACFPFANEDLWTVTIRVVIVVDELKELISTLVVVVVQHIGLHPLQWSSRDDLQLWILGLDRLIELRVPTPS
jgi:hypothetical protein